MVIYSVALCIMALLSGGALAQADYPQRSIRSTDIGDASPGFFAAYIKTELAKWARVVKDANIHIE